MTVQVLTIRIHRLVLAVSVDRPRGREDDGSPPSEAATKLNLRPAAYSSPSTWDAPGWAGLKR